jgi:7,8-dihydropterin-6-yl-methyl-4-(beta-D-ribofuranosyl)aminobenzene 5'-phosphate synthase
MCAEHHPDPSAVVQVAPRQLDDVDVETIDLVPVDGVTITTLLDNVSDMLLVDQGPARRAGLGATANPPLVAAEFIEGGKTLDALRAEHGFSALVTIHRGAQQHHILFDTGMSPDGMVANLRRLDIDPLDIEVIVLSHGHFDHTTGLDGYVRAVGRANVPVLIHPAFWSRRRIAIPGRDPIELPSTSRRALDDAGFDVIEQERPSFLFQGSVLITGEVPRTTAFERGMQFHEARHGDHWEPDPLILDDQALLVNVAGRGLVVLTGCGHSGVVNIARYAHRLTGIDHLHALIGGFHLNGPLFEPVIGPTCDALAELSPDVIVPAHCTGWKATHALAARFPDAFIQNSVGTRYDLTAAA